MQGKRTRFAVLALTVAIAAAGILVMGGRAFAQDDERPITLDVREATLDDTLRLIFRPTSYSYVLAPGVSGQVTVMFNKVPFSQALRYILDTHNLTYRREAGNVYYITEKLPDTTPPPPPPQDYESARQRLYWFGPGGRYEFQYLDCRQVANWFGFGGWIAGPLIAPVAAEGGGGGVGGGRGGGGGGAGRGGGGGGAGGGGAGGGGRGGGGGGSGGGGSGGGGGGRGR